MTEKTQTYLENIKAIVSKNKITKEQKLKDRVIAELLLEENINNSISFLTDIIDITEANGEYDKAYGFTFELENDVMNTVFSDVATNNGVNPDLVKIPIISEKLQLKIKNGSDLTDIEQKLKSKFTGKIALLDATYQAIAKKSEALKDRNVKFGYRSYGKNTKFYGNKPIVKKEK